MSTSIQSIQDLHQAELYLYFYEDFIDDEKTEQECEFMERALGLYDGASILDLACGHGRHSIALAGQGYWVTGLDLNAAFIDLAKKSAEEKQLNASFYLQNILDMEFEGEFDAAILFYNSFGFFDKKDAETLMKKVYRSLKKGGKVLIDAKNRDLLAKELPACSVLEKNEDLMIDRVTFDPLTGTTNNRRIYIKDGKRTDTPFQMYAYHYSDLKSMAENVGFSIPNVWGNWKGDAFGSASRRILMLCQK